MGVAQEPEPRLEAPADEGSQRAVEGSRRRAVEQLDGGGHNRGEQSGVGPRPDRTRTRPAPGRHVALKRRRRRLGDVPEVVKLRQLGQDGDQARELRAPLRRRHRFAVHAGRLAQEDAPHPALGCRGTRGGRPNGHLGEGVTARPAVPSRVPLAPRWLVGAGGEHGHERAQGRAVVAVVGVGTTAARAAGLEESAVVGAGEGPGEPPRHAKGPVLTDARRAHARSPPSWRARRVWVSRIHGVETGAKPPWWSRRAAS